MEIMKFARQIEELLYMGTIQGQKILKLHYLLQSYKQGRISTEAVQEAIDDFRPIGF